MEIQQQKLRDREGEGEGEGEKHSTESKIRDVQETKQQVLQLNPPSPTSASSSPSHEFSFTISVHPSISKIPDKSTNPNSSFAIDLSPADEIFFHGHLLPLHLLSNLPVSPRSSTNSLDSFTLPIHELLREENSTKPTSSDECNSLEYPTSQQVTNSTPGKPRGKLKSFSFLKLSSWKKGCESRQVLDQETGEKRKSKFDVLKRCVRMVKPFLSFRNGRAGNHQLIDRQSYSFSGNLRVKNKKELRGRRGEFSAPASFSTSPTNSGPLVPKGTLTPSYSKVDSTMEELQAAIQAAIAHCKKSIAIEDKIKNP